MLDFKNVKTTSIGGCQTALLPSPASLPQAGNSQQQLWGERRDGATPAKCLPLPQLPLLGSWREQGWIEGIIYQGKTVKCKQPNRFQIYKCTCPFSAKSSSPS